MKLTAAGRSKSAIGSADTAGASPSDWRSELLQGKQIQGSVRDPAGDIGIVDAMRSIVWITGVAFGVVTPGAFAQSAFDASTAQDETVFQKRDANRDSLVSRDGAKRNYAFEPVVSKTDIRRDADG